MNGSSARRRYILPYEARVWCSGRWGRRRVRDTQCHAVVRAEDVYTAMLKDHPPPAGAKRAGRATCTLDGRECSIDWELRPNAVWRHGRMFLRCGRCGERCTRLYLPLPESELACRRCWGLTYGSKTLQNYKDSIWGRSVFAKMFGTTQREWAYETTQEKRRVRQERSRERWRQRRTAQSAERPA